MVFIARGGRPGLLGIAARTAVVAGTATAVSGSVARNQQRRAAEEQARMQQALPPQAPQPPFPTAPEPAVADFTAQVQQLAALHQQGILTDDEFSSAKQRLINGQ